MDVFEKATPCPEKAVAAIGNFDGVHIGHRALLYAARQIAEKTGARAGVVTFHPHPRRFFRPDDPPFLLTTPETKLELIAKEGMDFTASLPFDENLARLSGEEFAKLLKNDLRLGHVVIGDDFRFGRDRGGSAQTLRDAGLDVTIVAPVGAGGARASSTLARKMIAGGDFRALAGLLGYEWFFEAPVLSQKGDRAEIDYRDYTPLPEGRLIARVEVAGVLREAVVIARKGEPVIVQGAPLPPGTQKLRVFPRLANI